MIFPVKRVKEELINAFAVSNMDIDSFSQMHNIQPEALSMVCSIDLKKNEAGLINFCSSHGLTLTCYSSQDLSKVHGNFPSSKFVSETTGVDNVCQRSAALACGGSHSIIMEKTVIDGITLSFGIKPMEFSFDYQ